MNRKPVNSPLRRRLVAYGLILVVLLAWPAWQRIQAASLLSQAHRKLSQDDFQGAIAALTQLHQIQPGKADVQYLLGVAHRRSGALDLALLWLRRAERSGCPAESIERQRLLAQFQAGEIEDNRRAIENLLQQDLDAVATKEVYEALAKGYLSAFRLGEARACLQYWLEWRPEEVQPKLWLAQLLEQQEDFAGAARLCESVLATVPDHHEARLRLAQCRMEQNRVAEGVAIFEQLHRERPNDMEILVKLASSRRSAGQEEQAQQLLERALAAELSPGLRAVALLESGQILFGKKDVAGALAQFEEAVQLSPNNQQAHHALGTALARDGRQERAQFHLNRSAEMLEHHNRIRNITHDLVRNPDNAELQYEVGRALMELGLKQEALRWLLLAAGGDKPPAAAHATLADLYYEIGNKPLADQHRGLAQRQALLEASRKRSGTP